MFFAGTDLTVTSTRGIPGVSADREFRTTVPALEYGAKVVPRRYCHITRCGNYLIALELSYLDLIINLMLTRGNLGYPGLG
jgi:hypothetical protein